MPDIPLPAQTREGTTTDEVQMRASSAPHRLRLRRAPLAVAAATALALAACGDGDVDDDVTAEDAAEDLDEGTAAEADDDAPEEPEDVDTPTDADVDGEVVAMAFFAFEPEELTVPAGTTVTWVNEDTVRHTATADDGTFDVDTPEEGDEGSFTFDEPGEYSYVCEVHASMTGTITVE